MPHVVLQTTKKLTEMEKSFHLKHVEENEVHVNYMALFQNREQNGLLIEAYVKEEPLAQRVGITIRQRENDIYVIGLSEIGFPRPTWGLQLAVSQCAKWLLALDANSQIVSQNLATGLL